jgi:hypothetical protein
MGEALLDDRKLADSTPIGFLRHSDAAWTGFAPALEPDENPRLAHEWAENGGHPANVG